MLVYRLKQTKVNPNLPVTQPLKQDNPPPSLKPDAHSTFRPLIPIAKAQLTEPTKPKAGLPPQESGAESSIYIAAKRSTILEQTGNKITALTQEPTVKRQDTGQMSILTTMVPRQNAPGPTSLISVEDFQANVSQRPHPLFGSLFEAKAPVVPENHTSCLAKRKPQRDATFLKTWKPLKLKSLARLRKFKHLRLKSKDFDLRRTSSMNVSSD